MQSAEQILVIIVSTTLTLFLILAIVLFVKLIQIIGHLKRLTQKAEELAGKAEAVTAFFERTQPTVALSNLVSNIANTVFSKHHKKSAKEQKEDE